MRPLGTTLVVEQDEIPTQSTGGIFINTMKLRHERPNEGIVQTVGDDCTQLKPGDRVKFSKYAGVYFQLEGKEYVLMSESEVEVVVIPD